MKRETPCGYRGKLSCCRAGVAECIFDGILLNTPRLTPTFIFLRPYLTPTKRWWRCLLWCTTYEPCQPGTRLSYARGRSLFLCAATQSIRTTRSPSATDAPCATSFIWGEPADLSTFFEFRTVVLCSNSPSSSYWSPARFQSSKSGKIYLHRDIRLLFSRKSMEVDSGAAYELQSFTESPVDPPFSPRCWDARHLFHRWPQRHIKASDRLSPPWRRL